MSFPPSPATRSEPVAAGRSEPVAAGDGIRRPAGRLVDGPVGRTLLSQAAPMFAGILANIGFQVAETWFIGRLGARELAALAFCMPVAMSVISVAIGLSAGTSVAVARALGSGQPAAARRLATDAVLLTFGVIATLGLATALAIRPLFDALGAGPELLPLIEGYLQIWLPGVALFMVPMVGLGAVRAAGDTRFQGGAMIAAVALNALLDPLLIFGAGPVPALGLRGAAFGNVAAWTLFCAAALWKMRQEGLLETQAPPRWKVFRASTRSILHVGLPAAATNAIIPLSTALIVGILAGFGPEAVAGLGIATRIEGLAMISFLGLSAVVNPFFAANAGAGRPERLHEALRLLLRFALGFGVVAAAVLWLVAPWLATRFTDDAAVAAVATGYLRLVPISYGAAGLIMTSNAAFNGLGLPLSATAISALRMFALNVPVAWLGARWFGVPGVFLGIATANLVVGTLATVWIRRRAPSPG
ncbi:MATE family efflux transporter [Myxococcota bacterium]|nr:MATE family efflux transporter [Myxococcota bacterium]